MIGSRAWFALMRRNLVYRKRHWFSTLLELALPMGFIGVLLGIKSAVEGSSNFEPKTIPASLPTNEDVFTPFTFDDYIIALQAKRVCVAQSTVDPSSNTAINYFDMTGMPFQGNSWQVPMLKCDPRNCEADGEDGMKYCEFAILALSGTDDGGLERASLMRDYVLGRYPVLTNNESIPVSFDLVQLFDSPLAMDQYVKSADYGNSGYPKIAMGIVFEGNDPDNYLYQLRQNSTNFNNPTAEGRPAVATTPDTSTKFASFAKDDDEPCVPLDGAAEQGERGNSCTGQYAYNGVLTFQRLVGDFILDQTGAVDAGYKISRSGVQYVPFPTREFEEEGFYGAIASFAPLLIVLGLLYPVSSMISYVVKEKELRQKELMKMMSVSESDIGWSWFTTFFVFNILSAILTSLVANAVYENSNNLMMLNFWIYVYVAITSFCLGVAAFTSKTTRAVLIGILLFLAGYFISIAVDYTTTDSSLLSLVGLHPVAALSFGLQEIGRLEDLGVGITRDSMDFSELESGYSFSQALNSLFADAILWGILSWYLNRVIRPDYGQALPVYFPFTRSYWCPGRASLSQNEDLEGNEAAEHVPIEPVSEALKRQSAEGQNIDIRNLVKKFDDKVAVDGLNLTMYSGQITALLGHNGAGKTTTISMLTGAIAPTTGHAIVAGKDIRSDMLAIRQDIGVCLQHDCLFPDLTVREHVQFFARLKGLYSRSSKDEAENHVDQAIRDVALFDKRNTLSKNLSGGMKRKLSVAIAFCGGSKVVLLDEPTSGMDPFSRRFTWNVIRQYRRDRCIILTTHFMDEADILGDRIAIMAEGQLRCAGSSLFLKKTFGVGYQLTIEKKKSNRSSSSPDLVSLQEHDAKLMEIVETNVPESTLLTNVGSELSYQLPMGAAAQFAPMFKALDQEIEDGKCVSYGVGITTLDEVFLLVARGEGTGDKKEFASSNRVSGVAIADDGTKSARSRMDLENEGLFFRHVGALLKKRAAFFRRDKKAWCCTTLLPSIFVLIGFILFNYVSPDRNLDTLVLDLNDFNQGINEARNPIPFNSPDNPFLCQPGSCFYPEDRVQSEETNEAYIYCGGQGQLSGTEKCSITVSNSVISQIDDAGAVPVELAVENITEASTSLSTSTGVGGSSATQYGAIFFTKDQSSTIDDSAITFEQAASDACTEIAPGLNYTSTDDCLDFGGIGYVIQYNFTALHVAPLYQALADEALVRDATGNANFNVECMIAPLPITKNEENFGEAEDAFSAWFLVVLSFPFIGGAFASFVVAERESKAKHLQTVAGVNPAAYWLSTYLWDIMNYQIPLWITIILMLAFDVNVLTTKTGNVFGGVVILLFLFGPASAAFAYCVSYAFKSPSLCFMVIMISGFLIGMGGPLAVFIMQIIGEDRTDPNEKLVRIANVLSWLLRWNPYFCLGKGLFNVINIESFRFWEADENLSAFSGKILGLEVLFLAIQAVLYLALAVGLDVLSSNPAFMSVLNSVVSSICCRGGDASFEATLPDDSDVIAEQERVLQGEANDDLIVINQLTKMYDTGKKAVDNISLGIPAGECFGLLGINGAGKTTTMGILTAEFPPTSGDATLAGYSVSREPQKTRRRIGYCPQFDAHFANLTGREHVELYAAIKGVPTALVKEAAAAKLKEVGLSDKDSDRLSVGYSGGMKRRLSLACATIGQPQIVFLDECSTGVDPVARREIWQLVSDMVSGGNVPDNERTSVILTTHSMEECEALCPRIAIMANGKLRCLGSAQHLKNKFGQGYQVELKVKIIDTEDEDYVLNATSLAQVKNASIENPHDVLYNLDEAQSALRSLTGDTFLADMVTEENPSGYPIWKDAISGVGVSLESLAAFATVELRMKNVEDFVKRNYPQYILRERQDTKARYEVSSKGVRISDLFASIETEKENLRLSDYGVSQTSLEQVFNMHAAEAEKLKQGRNDH